MPGRHLGLIIATLAVVSLGSAACASPPAPLPDPIISCDAVGGPISYSPGASNAGVDLTITAEPGAALSGCTDNTGHGLTGATITASFLMPAFVCGGAPAGTEIGSGFGSFTWSNGSTSDFGAVLRSPGTPNQFILEVENTAGLWVGAHATVTLGVVTSNGNCVNTPVTEAELGAVEIFELHPAGTP